VLKNKPVNGGAEKDKRMVGEGEKGDFKNISYK
jgi:hypothetical protein